MPVPQDMHIFNSFATLLIQDWVNEANEDRANNNKTSLIYPKKEVAQRASAEQQCSRQGYRIRTLEFLKSTILLILIGMSCIRAWGSSWAN